MKFLNPESIDEIVTGKCIVKFYTNSCNSCKHYRPIFDEFTERYDGTNIKIAKINADKNDDLAKKFEVNKVPTTLFIKDGKVVKRKVGLLDYDRLIMNISHKLY